jgi:DNA-binding NtrC family response regulator
LKAESFAVVLSDYHMPGMNGLRFLQAARECESKASFIMVTGDPTDDILTDGLRLGLVALLKKPLTRTALVPLIQHAIEYSYLQHEVVELRRTLSESGIGLGNWIDRIRRYPSEEPQVLLPF